MRLKGTQEGKEDAVLAPSLSRKKSKKEKEKEKREKKQKAKSAKKRAREAKKKESHGTVVSSANSFPPVQKEETDNKEDNERGYFHGLLSFFSRRGSSSRPVSSPPSLPKNSSLALKGSPRTRDHHQGEANILQEEEEVDLLFHEQSLGLRVKSTQRGLEVILFPKNVDGTEGEAERQGKVQLGDVIVALNGSRVHSLQEFSSALQDLPRPLAIRVQRKREVKRSGESDTNMLSPTLSALSDTDWTSVSSHESVRQTEKGKENDQTDSPEPPSSLISTVATIVSAPAVILTYPVSYVIRSFASSPSKAPPAPQPSPNLEENGRDSAAKELAGVKDESRVSRDPSPTGSLNNEAVTREDGHEGVSRSGESIEGNMVRDAKANASSLLSEREMREISHHLPFMLRERKLVQLYDSDVDGLSIFNLYRKAADRGPLLLLIKERDRKVRIKERREDGVTSETKEGRRFGSFLTGSLKSNGTNFIDGQSFVFSLSPIVEVHRWTGKNTDFSSSSSSFLAIGGGKGVSLLLSEEMETGRSSPCETFNENKSLASQEDFRIAKVEAWAFAAYDGC